MKYTVKLITKDSEHEASKELEDDEILIVEDEEGSWWDSSEFFLLTNVKSFSVNEPLPPTLKEAHASIRIAANTVLAINSNRVDHMFRVVN
jgi:hypothetical protein